MIFFVCLHIFEKFHVILPSEKNNLLNEKT